VHLCVRAAATAAAAAAAMTADQATIHKIVYISEYVTMRIYD
jgi:hypothetical protein